MANNNLILTVEKTLGGLREINLGSKPAFRLVSYDKFHAEKVTLRVWSDYGQYNEDRIHLYIDGEEPSTIRIGDVEFSPVIKDIHYFQRSSSVADHTFTLNGKKDNGEIFEKEFFIKGHEVLPSIIYAMCIISHLEDIALSREYWHVCLLQSHSTTKGEFLNKVLAFKDASEKML